MAVKAPFGPTSAFNRAFSPVPDSPWPNSAMTPSSGAAHGNIFHVDPTFRQLSASSMVEEEPNTPASDIEDITAPSPSTSETSTVFTDVDGEEEPGSAQPVEEPVQALQVEDVDVSPLRSATGLLKLNTSHVNSSLHSEEDAPQSVIHIPSAFGRFHMPPGNNSRPSSRLSQGRSSHHSQRSLSESSTSSHTAEPIQRPQTTSSNITESSAASESTLKPESEQSEDIQSEVYHGQMPLEPLLTQIPSSKDWASTPRAQTRQDFLSFSRPGSSLASKSFDYLLSNTSDRLTGIREGDGDAESQHAITDASADELDPFSRRRISKCKSANEIEALEVALAECWTLCNTLANLSNRYREQIFGDAKKGDRQEQAWKSCWKLCQNLYETRDDSALATTRPTLTLCRDFCQALFEVRVKGSEAADSVLRVSFELNNHLFNTHDRTLPEAFRERTLDFYITLCHRLMKQRSKLAAETDSLLKACWMLAEMLFSLRQSNRENRKPDQELLGSAMQACWDLCDLFREGWTQIRPDRGTPRATQTTFSQAFTQAKRAGYIDDQNTFKIAPETPTTIFDDTATVSPEEAPAPNIVVMQSDQHLNVPQSAKSTASAPPALPRPNTTQRIASRTAPYMRQNRWNSINEMIAEEDVPSRPVSAMSQDSRASSTHMSITSLTSSQHTIRTPAEDPSLTILKALFVRAATQTGRGFSSDPRNAAGRDTTYTSLPLFVRSLPENAFGSQIWQKNLLENYKKTVAADSTFKYLGTTAAAIGLGPDPVKGREEIATVLKGMVDNAVGWAWLRDLFRYGYGEHIEDIINKSNEARQPVQISQKIDKERSSSQPSANTKERSMTNGSRNERSNSKGSNGVLASGRGNEGRKVSPPRR